MNLALVPCQLFNYGEVEVWSLRPQYEVSTERIVERSLRGDIYPYKTAKHRFPTPVASCAIELTRLMGRQGATA